MLDVFRHGVLGRLELDLVVLDVRAIRPADVVPHFLLLELFDVGVCGEGDPISLEGRGKSGRQAGNARKTSSRTQERTLHSSSLPRSSAKSVSTTQYATLRLLVFVAHSTNSRATELRMSRSSRQMGGPQAK